METTELKKIMSPNKADAQGHGIVEFYTPEQVVEILRIHDAVGRSERLVAFLEFVVDYKMLEVDLEYEEIAKRFLGN
jgi:hypothetical protein